RRDQRRSFDQGRGTVSTSSPRCAAQNAETLANVQCAYEKYLSLLAGTDPVGRRVGETNVGKASPLHHGCKLGASASPFNSGAKAIQRIRPHAIEAAVRIEAKRPRSWNLKVFGDPRERPIDRCRNYL